ncbi:diguanylate cyclase domain-containing protein [Agarivorans sp. QJM3NY_33]|uniref:diguanylate cyclase domain-containing protein n=1 Tax=Agarivorans sp. QJM3NY_33 TaxID=3421432 RepID=UPI003D7EFB0B
MNEKYSHLPHIRSHDELPLYELIPNVVWIFDLDKHGWWWGNSAAVRFWGLENLGQLIAKDLSGDTQGARERTAQTFELAAKNGLTVDPWTTYPNGKPKTLHMMHRAVLVGPDKHRAIIAFINEEVDLGAEPENLLLVEAMRYTTVLVTSFTQAGEVVIENPAATEAYKHLNHSEIVNDGSTFAARFADPKEGERCREQALKEQGGRWEYVMNTSQGKRTHTLDIRITRHPLSGDFLLLVVEYDITELHLALTVAEEAQEQLRQMAHYDALTGLSSLHLMQENVALLIHQAARVKQRLTLMFIDLDDFKTVNDTYGHDAGDEVLKAVAERLKLSLRKSDFIARLGGDEFIIVQMDSHTEQQAAKVASKIIETLAKPYALNNGQAEIGASIGIAFYPEHGNDLECLIKAADESMYVAKRRGKNSYYFA